MDKKYLEDYRQLGLNIKFYRKNKRYTQLKLAEMVGVDITHISKIESCKVGASIDIIFAVAEALEIPARNLFDFRSSILTFSTSL